MITHPYPNVTFPPSPPKAVVALRVTCRCFLHPNASNHHPGHQRLSETFVHKPQTCGVVELQNFRIVEYGIIEPQNHYVGKDLEDYQVQPLTKSLESSETVVSVKT